MSDVVDHPHLDRLAARFGASFVVQLIDLFIAQGQERVIAAERAAAAGDVAGVTMAAHALRSSAGNLGAVALGDRAAGIEQGGTVAAALPPLAAALREDFARAAAALTAVRTELAGRSGLDR